MLLLVIPLEKITMRAGDGLELEGFLSGPRAGRAIIFIHGWKDNAFTAPFVKPMAERAAKAGIAFLAFNNRGAGKKGETERFADCILDIRAAVEFMAGRGHERIFLVGHSTGCQKAAYYVHKEKDDRIGGIAFIEPTDDAALARRELGEKYGKAVGLAREMVASGERNRMMPEWSLVGGEASADRYLSMFSGEEAEGGMFDFSGKLELISG
ncbi:TPA: alpha/beta fold hydrolase, partial [Candidatus Micrarchaeota archaeon]|nr:alpha/beta fold hydrolase [Candidatus Micrarchaeota archaeon]